MQNQQYSLCPQKGLTLGELSVLAFLKGIRKTHVAFQTTTPWGISKGEHALRSHQCVLIEERRKEREGAEDKECEEAQIRTSVGKGNQWRVVREGPVAEDSRATPRYQNRLCMQVDRALGCRADGSLCKKAFVEL